MSRPPYRLLSLLLSYPDDEILAAREEIAAAARPHPGLRDFVDGYWASTPPLQLRQDYVETFDLQRRTSLYLTFFSDGDTRRRGQALLRLKRLYANAGLHLEGRELPDFLPVMLECAELAPDGVGRRLLAEHRRALELIRLRLAELESPYRHLLEAVCAGLPRLSAADLEAVAGLLRDGPPAEAVGLAAYGPPEVVSR